MYENFYRFNDIIRTFVGNFSFSLFKAFNLSNNCIEIGTNFGYIIKY